ncbi:retron system putative HNH endonuclease [Tumidithrix helvetica PCC 7403]|uniref:retron system putative HNH endonuclease n=1 Tax=Tumidithrix helvetica TaxID=3457545 RepID=UPI003C8AD8DC
MRYIRKGQEPPSFSDWKAQENDDWKPTFNTLRGKIKSAVHDALLSEQGYTCCYCGMSITKNISHIEHLKPQSKYKDLALDFKNLLASCGISETFSAEYENVHHCLEHCGIKKDNELLAVSPLQPDCAEFFRYTGSGEIRPTEDSDRKQAALDSLETLNLNESRLKAMREEAIDGALQGIEELTSAELDLLIESYEQPNQQAFSFAIAYILKQF